MQADERRFAAWEAQGGSDVAGRPKLAKGLYLCQGDR